MRRRGMPGILFIAIGITFMAIGTSGQRAFYVIGVAFLAIGVVSLARGR